MPSGYDKVDADVLLERLEAAGLASLVEAAADRYHVSVADVLGPMRLGSIVAARREACVRLYVDAGKSTTEVGWFLGLEHTTVGDHLRKEGVERRRTTKRRLAKAEVVAAQLKGVA